MSQSIIIGKIKKNNKIIKCFNDQYNNGIVTFEVLFPGVQNPLKVPNISSYLNNVVSSTTLSLPLSPVYNCWCLDSSNIIVPGQQYTYDAYSILDYRVLSTNSLINPLLKIYKQCQPNLTLYVKNLPLILYIINKAKIYESVNGFSSDDIQTAIWTLMNHNMGCHTNLNVKYTGLLITNNNMPPVSSRIDSNVYSIINDALAVVCTLDCVYDIPLLFDNPIMGIVIVPKNTCNQILLICVQLDQIDINCPCYHPYVSDYINVTKKLCNKELSCIYEFPKCYF